MWLKIKEKLPFFLSVQACIFLVCYAYGCESQTQSLIDPSRKVTRPQLASELELILLKSKAGISHLDSQDELRAFIFNQVFTVVETGQINPLGVATSLMAVLGIGVTADDIRLRKKVKKQVAQLETAKNGSD